MDIQNLSVFDDLAEFLASLSPDKVLAYKAGVKAQERLEALLEKNKEDNLSSIEKEELTQYMMVEHLVRLAKARAHRILAQRAA